jgi:hypothetical protein
MCLAAVGIRAPGSEPAVAAGVPESFGTLGSGLHTIWLFLAGIYLALSEFFFALISWKNIRNFYRTGVPTVGQKHLGLRFKIPVENPEADTGRTVRVPVNVQKCPNTLKTTTRKKNQGRGITSGSFSLLASSLHPQPSRPWGRSRQGVYRRTRSHVR